MNQKLSKDRIILKKREEESICETTLTCAVLFLLKGNKLPIVILSEIFYFDEWVKEGNWYSRNFSRLFIKLVNSRLSICIGSRACRENKARLSLFSFIRKTFDSKNINWVVKRIKKAKIHKYFLYKDDPLSEVIRRVFYCKIVIEKQWLMTLFCITFKLFSQKKIRG